MQPERTILLSQTIPELRYRLARLGYTLAEVDLRWGVTRTQIEAGVLLERCLDQVERASPFFIGLIGETYGTILDTVYPELLTRWPWLADCKGKSLTEIEIRCGAFLNFNPYARFYFKRASSVSEQLANLKSEIIGNGYKPRYYDDAEGLDQLVHSDLWSVLQVHCLKGTTTAQNEFFQPTRWHDAIVGGLTPVIDSSIELRTRIDALGQRPVAIVSDDDRDRTALIATLSKHYGVGPPSDPILTYFATATHVHCNSRVLLKTIQSKLLTECGFSYIPSARVLRGFEVSRNLVELPNGEQLTILSFDGIGKAGPVFREMLLAASAAGTRFALFLDGLDHFGPGDLPIDFIPEAAQMLGQVRVVVGFRRGKLLDRAIELGYFIIEIDRLDPASITHFTTRYLLRFGKTLDQGLLAEVSRCSATASAWFLRLFLERLRFAATPEALTEIAVRLLSAQNVSQLLNMLLDDIRDRLGAPADALMDQCLKLTVVSRFGARLEHIIGISTAVSADEAPMTLWKRVRGELAELLQECLSSTHMQATRKGYRPGILYRCSSPMVREMLRQRCFPDDAAEERQHKSAARYYVGAPDLESWAELAWHLWRSKQWSRLARVLSSTAAIEKSWLWDQELLLRYCRDVAGYAGISISDLIAEELGSKETPAPEAISELLNTLEPTKTAEDSSLTFSADLDHRQPRPFSWAQVVIGEAQLSRPETDQLEMGYQLDELEDAVGIGNKLAIARAQNRLGRLKCRLGQNLEAMECFHSAVRALDEVRTGDIAVFNDGRSLLHRELIYALAGERDCLTLLGRNSE